MSNNTQNNDSMVCEDTEDHKHNENNAIDDKNNQTVDSGEQKINEFNSSKNYLTNYYKTNKTIGYFDNETDICLDSDNEMDTDLNNESKICLTNGDITDDKNGNNSCEETITESEVKAIVCENIKYDITETDELITVYVYVKQIDIKDIQFKEDSFEVRFRTCDQTFNEQHRNGDFDREPKISERKVNAISEERTINFRGKQNTELIEDNDQSMPELFDNRPLDFQHKRRASDLQSSVSSESNPDFIWRIFLRDKIVPEKCSYKQSQTKFEIKLNKKSTRFRWSSLEQTPNTPTALLTKQMSNNNFNINDQPFIGPKQEFEMNNTNIDNSMSGNWQPIITNEDKVEWSHMKSNSYKSVSSNDNISSVGKELVAINDNVINNDLKHRRVGYTGLDNLGNTCFMNAVIQCLSNTDPFRDYFSSDHFMQDINESNPLGTGGQIATAFALLLKQLWLGKLSSVPPQRLKNIISEKVSQQFSGFAQHDAQELMAFLLDALHEDLNRIKQKPYISVNSDECDNRNIADEQLADESWKRYRMRNDSIVVDLFQGQFKSKLVCPVCGKISITFDPFLYLSVPFPKPPIVHEVYFFKRDSNGMSTSKPIKYSIKLPHDSTVQKLLDYVSEETKVPASALRLIKASNNGSFPTFLANTKWTLTKPQTGELLLLYELLAHNESAKQDIQEFCLIQRLSQPTKSDNCAKCDKCSDWDSIELKACTKCYRVSYCDRSCQSDHWSVHRKDCVYKPEPIGLPFIISVAKSQLTYRNLCAIVYSYARHSIRIPHNNENLVLNLNEFPIHPPFVLKSYKDLKTDENEEVISAQREKEDGDNDNDNDNDQPLDINNYYIALDWINSKNFGNNCVEVESLGIDCEVDYKSSTIADRMDCILLEDCLRLFTEPEVLNPQEAWFCPKCKENREATKQIALWRLPQVLVIQLKRFSFRNIIWRDKIDRMVRYPINGLDISDFYCRTEYDPDFRPIYDLYGVVNHYGGMFGGHYIAFSKSSNNLENLGWRTFDDSRVEDMSEESVLNRNAYMLFYKLRES